MATSIGNDISNTDPEGERVLSHAALSGDLLVCLPPMVREAREHATAAVLAAFPNASLRIAVTELDTLSADPAQSPLVPYEEARNQTGWALHVTDYLAAATVARKYDKQHVLLLGSDAPSGMLLQSLARGLTQSHADVVMPRLQTSATDGLVNSALLYPMTRALLGQDIRFPLPHNIGLSRRALERLASEAQREVSAGRSDSLLWPVSVATAAGYSVRQVDSNEHLPVPAVTDFNRLFAEVIGSLLADTEARAINWQRSRYVAPAHSAGEPLTTSVQDPDADVVSMVEGFRVAYANLLPIWSLVLPPQSLLALKKLAPVPPQAFLFPPELWARVVYDFALAFHLRTINRNHLLGALTPLYLAWAASHIRCAAGDATEAERLVHATAAAFEAEKPYFVSRWRWPDRFNP
jgi:hypothetical protein